MVNCMRELMIRSTIDGTLQPSLFYDAGESGRPLLVGLHTWSTDRFNQLERLLPISQRNRWNLLLPEFRGPNLPENPHCRNACGSALAKQDILDGVAYVQEHWSIDEENLFLVGFSGGGHMALLMAGLRPKLWKAVCAFVPITDLKVWHGESERYRPGIEACCGVLSSQTEQEYALRSPMTYTDQIAEANVKIWSGKWDKSVPCHHGLDLFLKIFREHPEAHVYFEMFDGGHQALLEDAERWLKVQSVGESENAVNVTG